MSEIYFLLGANLGDKTATFAKASKLLGDLVGATLAKSSLYESEAWGFESDKLFLNQVLKVESLLLPENVLEIVKQIELRLGRIRSGTCYESRIIDIDILFYDSLIISSSTLSIPHPLLHKRMFTLAPLCELAPNFIHPLLQKSVLTLKNECEDYSVVRLAQHS